MTIETFLAAAVAPEELFFGAGALGATGRTAELAALFDAYLARGHDPEALYETTLQLYLFAGYPRAINALAELHDVRARAGLGPLPERPEQYAWRERGEALCRRIYGKNYERLQQRMRQISPELARWMIDEGYGKVLARPALDAAARECSVVGALVALEAERQLASHLRGSLNLGVPAARLFAGIALLEHLLPPGTLAAAQRLLDSLGCR